MVWANFDALLFVVLVITWLTGVLVAFAPAFIESICDFVHGTPCKTLRDVRLEEAEYFCDDVNVYKTIDVGNAPSQPPPARLRSL